MIINKSKKIKDKMIKKKMKIIKRKIQRYGINNQIGDTIYLNY